MSEAKTPPKEVFVGIDARSTVWRASGVSTVARAMMDQVSNSLIEGEFVSQPYYIARYVPESAVAAAAEAAYEDAARICSDYAIRLASIANEHDRSHRFADSNNCESQNAAASNCAAAIRARSR